MHNLLHPRRFVGPLLAILASALALTALFLAASAHADSTPTPTITEVFGDADCDGHVTALDALQDLRRESEVSAHATACWPQGEADCLDPLAGTQDAIFILDYLAGGSPVSPNPGCPPLGETLPPPIIGGTCYGVGVGPFCINGTQTPSPSATLPLTP